MIFDVLIRIQNGYRAKLTTVNVPYSTMVGEMLDLLSREGLIRGFSRKKETFEFCEVFLNRIAMFKVRLISKSTCRKYISYKVVRGKYVKSRNVVILSTNLGLMTAREIIENNLKVGGELICGIEIAVL
jgi:ribosomal protein S8